MKNTMKSQLAIVGGLTALILTMPMASAAVLIQRTSEPDSPNLTELANQDWALDNWSADYKHRMLEGDGSIGSPIAMEGALFAPSQGSTLRFSFSDGDSSASGGASETLNDATVRGFADNALGTVGSGFEFDITGSGLQQTAYVWVSGFNATGQFSVELEDVVHEFAFTDVYESTKVPILYTIEFTSSQTGNPLTVRYQMIENVSNNDNAHVLLSGSALHVIPEPSTLILTGLSLMALLGARRWKRN